MAKKSKIVKTKSLNDLILKKASKDLVTLSPNSKKSLSVTRLKNRCSFTGRPRGFHSSYGLCRSALRMAMVFGYIPGAYKG